ncbi:MAG: hypothetical protein LBG47_04280 [Prevotellaceae bacterium]|jgi:hypothetical protein|nr:hypothetical protein [Prevotellaceae bacterium]
MKKEVGEKYRNALAVFLNLATDNVEEWLRSVPNIPENITAIDALENKDDVEAQKQLFDSAVSHFYFLEWLYGKGAYFTKPNDEAAADKNCQTLAVYIKLLYGLRGYWSHVDHDEILLTGKPLREMNRMLLGLYMQACAESKTYIPEKYKGSAGINRVAMEISEDVYTMTKVIPKLSLTGAVFFTCLFLDGGQINNFLESLEQSCYTVEELYAQTENLKSWLLMPYSENPAGKGKDFLYARDVYKYWQLRGRRAAVISDAALDEKEACIDMFEYLKRCPREALKLSDAKRGKNSRILFSGHAYDIREKDKFFDWALAFWDDEMARLGIADWQWARHQATEKIQKAREKLDQQAKETGRPYHLPRHEKVAFGIPQDPQERASCRSGEHGATYFLLKESGAEGDSKADKTASAAAGDKATRALFRCKRSDGKMVIGQMSGRLLCSVLEWYFYKFPVGKDEYDAERSAFWMKFFHACFSHIENEQRAAKPKANASREQVKNRIGYLRKQYSAAVKQPHRQMQFILSTWNQIISYGCAKNRETAGSNKIKYQKLRCYLSLMTANVKEQLERAHADMVKLLENWGKNKSNEPYFEVINSAFSECGVSNIPSAVEKPLTVGEHVDLCKRYRLEMLNAFEEKLAAAFNVDDWRPAYEMRWLGLSDARTPQAARQASPATAKARPQTNVINVDNGSYPAAGLPRDVRHLAEENWQRYLKTLNGGCVEKIHPLIHPSPNGCTLLIPAFYENAAYTPSSRHSSSIRDHKRLYLIRRQDTVISHIAYKKWCSIEGKKVQDLVLQNFSHQNLEFDLPVGSVFIRFYYRYFKQNRHHLPPKLSKSICDLLQKRGFVQEGDHIDFSCMKPVCKAELTHEEQCRRLLSKQEQALPADQKEKLRKKYFERMDSVIFQPDRENGKLYFDEILQSYAICRRAMVDKIHRLERVCRAAYKITRNDGECYTDFEVYANKLVEKGHINEQEQAKLIKIRNAAFHGDIPEENYAPQDLLKKVKKNPDRPYFDYFGEGNALIGKILKHPLFKQMSQDLPQNQRK